MQIGRLLRHQILPDWWVLRAFPKPLLQQIEQAISASEMRHTGEIRFAVEANLPMRSLWHNQSAHERAIELFSSLRVWDTEHNSGVLIYVQLIDRNVEIIADRGIHARVGEAFWQSVCQRMEAEFHCGEFARGSLAALDNISTELVRHFPANGANPNELPNAPLIY